MKVVAKFGPESAGLIDRPDPVAEGEFVVVKIRSAPMCTEYKGFKNEGTGDRFGHEAAGEVVEIAQEGTVKVGDRVVVMPHYPCGKCYLCLAGEYAHCRDDQKALNVPEQAGMTATYAQYILKRDWQLVPVPDELSYHHAGMACCGLGSTFNAMRLMHVNALDTVLITGMGPIGLGGVINAVYRGAHVIAVESHPYRAALAKKLGAAEVVNPQDTDVVDQIRDLTGGSGVDKGIECSAAAEAVRLLIDVTRPKGHIALIGGIRDVAIQGGEIINKGLTLHGTRHYNLPGTPAMMRMITQVKTRLDTFITHTFPMHQIQEAWALQCTHDCGKVVLDPWA
ncbi:MAG: zinc-binding dehydrogenase [Candidatus Poribacteria bacterium]|nr:zinc-binding dehydrogenase [Candidatus Poribacteria bacterium]